MRRKALLRLRPFLGQVFCRLICSLAIRFKSSNSCWAVPVNPISALWLTKGLIGLASRVNSLAASRFPV
jgi:hypothetical protein